MTYLRLAITSLLLCSQLLFADSIKTYVVTSISMQMSPNDGSGDNISFSFTGPQVQITGIGGMGCFDWCSTDPIYGTPVVSPSQVFISNFSDPVVIGGVNYSGFDTGFNGQGLFNDVGGVFRFVSGSTDNSNSFIQFNLIFPPTGSGLPTSPLSRPAAIPQAITSSTARPSMPPPPNPAPSPSPSGALLESRVSSERNNSAYDPDP